MQRNPHYRSVRRVLAAAVIGVAAIAGCSSSSSGGDSSALNARSVSTETFHNVTPRANHIIQRSLALLRGVASTTYQGRDLTVTFRSTADKLDQHNVENLVHQGEQQATAKPASTPSHRAKK